MLMTMFACSGAGLRTSSPASGALVLTLALTLTSVTQVSAVCVHCKGFVDGCKGSAQCPLAEEITANGAAMEDPKTSNKDSDSRLHPSSGHDCCTEYSLGKLYLTLLLPPSSPERRGQFDVTPSVTEVCP